jgi:hypothetical protein
MLKIGVYFSGIRGCVLMVDLNVLHNELNNRCSSPSGTGMLSSRRIHGRAVQSQQVRNNMTGYVRIK